MQAFRPRLSLPYTLIPERDRVRLVAGEDFRYTLAGPGIDSWLPDWLARCDGQHTVAELLASLPAERREAARSLCERLLGERLLIDGSPQAIHKAARYGLMPQGCGAIHAALAESAAAEGGSCVAVLCQDRLDYEEALRFNQRCLRRPASEQAPFMWATSGPMTRGYVSPLFVPEAAPCLQCLLRHFQRLSPTPELYDELIAHRQAGRALPAVPFPQEAALILAQLVRWKASLLAEPDPPAALYRLHVLEVSTLEISSHTVFPDPECPACQECGR